MKEILKEKEIFELAKKKVISELEKEYDRFIDEINAKEIQRDVLYIKSRIGIISQKECEEINSDLLKDISDLKIEGKNVLSKINSVKAVFQ